MASAQDVYNFLVDYITKGGGSASSWYAGIATDVEKRLFTEHGVDKENGLWAHNTADSEEGARNVEKALLELGCSGGTGGGDIPKTVYVYLRTSRTNP